MKIIKEGRLPETIRFECEVCGCIFECTPDECNQCGVTFFHECPCCETGIVVIHDAGQLDTHTSIKETVPDQPQKVPSIDCDFPIETGLAPRAVYGSSFHGETWYRCPHCQSGFEVYQTRDFPRSLHNEAVMFCPHCGYGFVL